MGSLIVFVIACVYLFTSVSIADILQSSTNDWLRSQCHRITSLPIVPQSNCQLHNVLEPFDIGLIHSSMAIQSMHILQWHGYAQRYRLNGYTTKKLKKQKKEYQLEGYQYQGIYYAALILHFERDINDNLASTGTRSSQANAEPHMVDYKVHLQSEFPGNEVSIVEAWEIMKGRSTLQRLYILPTSKLNNNGKSATPLSVWVLAGGIIFLCFGLLLMYLTMQDNANNFGNPASQSKSSGVGSNKRAHRLESDENWELCE